METALTCFLAVQGYDLDQEFILKEIALLNENGTCFHVWNLAPPFSIHNSKFNDRLLVRKKIKSGFDIPWEIGTVPYHQVPLIFEQIAREFNLWYVSDVETKARIFSYKSLNVKIDVLNLNDTKPSRFSCIYNHKDCAFSQVTRLYDKFKRK